MSNVVRMPSATTPPPDEKPRPRPKHVMELAARWDFESALMGDHKLTLAAVKAAHVLLDSYNHHEGCSWPSAGTISERIGVTRSTASIAVNLLAERGWFRIDPTRSDGRQGSNRYFPCLDRAGPSVRSVEHLDPPSVRSADAQCSTERTPSVRFDGPPAFDPSNTNPAMNPAMNPGMEPRQENPASYALAREGRQDGSGVMATPSQRRGAQVRLPVEWQFPADAVAVARAKKLTEADISKALVAFRRLAGDDCQSSERWAVRGAAYLAKKEPAPADEMVQVGDILTGGRRCKVSEIKPWEAYRDSKGVHHPAKIGKPVGLLGTAMAI